MACAIIIEDTIRRVEIETEDSVTVVQGHNPCSGGIPGNVCLRVYIRELDNRRFTHELCHVNNVTYSS